MLYFLLLKFIDSLFPASCIPNLIQDNTEWQKFQQIQFEFFFYYVVKYNQSMDKYWKKRHPTMS